MSLDNYNKAFDELFAEDLGSDANIREARNNMSYSLETLGHCEFDYSDRRVYVCKPYLSILTGVGSCRVVMTGARGSSLLEKMYKFQRDFKEDVYIDQESQKIGNLNLPEVILLESLDIRIIEEFARSIGISFSGSTPSSWLIVNASGTLDEYEKNLVFEPGTDLDWIAKVFNTKLKRFESILDNNTVPRLMEYTNRNTQQKLHRWIIEDYTATVDREWGRYLALKHAKVDVLIFDENNHLLAVPSSIPLPKLLARAATLCSGKVSRKVKLSNDLLGIPPGYFLNIFSGITKSVADVIANKLSQQLLRYKFKFTIEGDII